MVKAHKLSENKDRAIFGGDGSDSEVLTEVLDILKRKGCEVGSPTNAIWLDIYKCSYGDITFDISLDEDYGDVELRVDNPEDLDTIVALFE